MKKLYGVVLVLCILLSMFRSKEKISNIEVYSDDPCITVSELSDTNRILYMDKPPMVPRPYKKYKPYSDYQIAMWCVKASESLDLTGKWDYKQWSNGWGTKGVKGERLTKAEADRRAKKEFTKAFNKVSSKYKHLKRWEKLVLASAAYNLGSFGPGLEKAINANDKILIAEMLSRYIHAGGEPNEGLIKRRELEAKLLLADRVEKQILAEQLRLTVLKHIRNESN